MLTRSAIFFPLLLAALLALITFWISQTVEQQGAKIDGSNRHDPDYFMNNFVTTQTDATGRLSYVLAAIKMVHFPDNDSTTLERPKITQFFVDKPYTQIEGTKGFVSGNGKAIKLVENVKVFRQALKDKGEMQVLTDQLSIFPDDNLAQTDRPVIIKQAPNTVIHATGMIYNNKNQTMQLLSRVQAHYDKPAADKAKTILKPSSKPANKANSKNNAKSSLNTKSQNKSKTKTIVKTRKKQ